MAGYSMTHITRSVEIAAKPEAVYELVYKVERFPLYSHFIKEVTKVGPNNYRWKAHINGLWFEWASAFVEKERPGHISWRSVSGLESHGNYVISAIPGGTKVTFDIEYHLPSHFLETALESILSPLIEEAFLEILHNIKKELELTPHRNV